MEEFKIPEMEIVEIETEKENLLDETWLFNNIPWGNHDNKKGKVILKEPTDLYTIEMDGFDGKSSEVVKFEFDNVMVLAMHGFGGNSYSFEYKLGDETVGTGYEVNKMGFSKEDLKVRFIKQLNQAIKGLNHQIKMNEDIIFKIQTL